VPVIASTACGLENISGVRNVPAGDVKSLRAEIERVIAGCLPVTIASEKIYQTLPGQILDRDSTSAPVAVY
jgi:hypothetical protein